MQKERRRADIEGEEEGESIRGVMPLHMHVPVASSLIRRKSTE